MTARSSSPDLRDVARIVARARSTDIALLSLNRPQARNTLSEAMLAALQDEFNAIVGDVQVRAVVIAHNGPAFCAGHDMKELTAHRSEPDRGRSYFKALMERCSALMHRSQKLPQPVIAAVRGGRHRRRLPTRRQLRPGGGIRNGAFSRRRAFISACSARPRWWRSRATSRTSTRWKCCSPATWFGRRRPSDRPRQSRGARRQGAGTRA